MSSNTIPSLNPFASESTFSSSSSVESVCGSIFDMSRTLSSETESFSSVFEHSSSEEDGFSVHSGEDVNFVFSDPFADDADSAEVLKSPSNAGTNLSRRQRWSSSGSRRSSVGSIASALEDDVEAGYEADSDGRITTRRRSTHRRRTQSRHRNATVHYLVERLEPTIEVLAPMTAEELAYLKAHTDIPIPAHYEALLAGKTPEIPSAANVAASETPSDRMGSAGGRTEPVAALQPQHLFAELGRQHQRDLGCDSFVVDESLQRAHEAVQDLPPTPDLRPWLAVASGEPSPMVLASPAVPLFLHAPRPPLRHMPTRH